MRLRSFQKNKCLLSISFAWNGLGFSNLNQDFKFLEKPKFCQRRFYVQPNVFDEQAVQQFLIEFSDAVKRQDAAAIDRMWADEYAFVTPTGVVLNKTQRLAAVTAPDTRFDFVSRDQADVHLYDNTAVEISRTSAKGQVLGQAVDQQYRVTTVLVKKNEGWQMVLQHFTVIPKQ
jgi:ketosteroid isomerase-like protein